MAGLCDLDIREQALGLVDLGNATVHVGQAARGFVRPAIPVGPVGLVRGHTLFRDGQRLFLRGTCGGRGGQLRACGLVRGARGIAAARERFGVGQAGERGLRRLDIAFCRATLIGEFRLRLPQDQSEVDGSLLLKGIGRGD